MSPRRFARISEFCQTGSGTTPSRQKLERYYGGLIPWVKSGELRESEILHTEEFVTEAAIKETSLKLVPAGALLVAMYGATVGRVGRLGIEATTNQAVCHVVPDQSIADAQYMFHALCAKAPEFIAKGVGGAQPNISQGTIKETEIYLPPLDEQKRIAAILDQADELRRKRQRTIDRLNQLGQAIFHEMFGDPKTNPLNLPRVALGDLADFYSGNSLPEGETFVGQSGGYLLLKVSDLNHPRNQQDIECAANWSTDPGSRAGTCPPNSLIFPKRGGAIGTNKKRWLKRSAILDPNLMGVHPDERRLTMSFLNGWFQTFNLSDITSGSSVPQLNKQDLAPLEMALPPLDDQISYGHRMMSLSETRTSAVSTLLHYDTLFTSLQHRAFRGEL